MDENSETCWRDPFGRYVNIMKNEIYTNTILENDVEMMLEAYSMQLEGKDNWEQYYKAFIGNPNGLSPAISNDRDKVTNAVY
jgi:hypothetical protein